MLISSWLRNWSRSVPAACRCAQTIPRQWASFRPRLEALEDRWLPSTLIPSFCRGDNEIKRTASTRGQQTLCADFCLSVDHFRHRIT